jgi:hypothetical protein
MAQLHIFTRNSHGFPAKAGLSSTDSLCRCLRFPRHKSWGQIDPSTAFDELSRAVFPANACGSRARGLVLELKGIVATQEDAQ